MTTLVDLTNQVKGILPVANGGTGGSLPPSGVTVANLQQQVFVYADDTGTANAYAISLSPAPTIVEGNRVTFKAANSNTGASTLAVNGGSATTIFKGGSTNLASGDILAGGVYECTYDGTHWQLTSWLGTSFGSVAPSQVQQEAFTYAADSGTANAYAVILSPAPAIVAGSEVVFKAANSNTGASTLAVNGGAATAIEKAGSTGLASGDIVAGEIYVVIFDGTNWQLVSWPGTSAGGSGTVTNTGTLTSGQPIFGNGGVNVVAGTKRGSTTVAQMADSTTNPPSGNLAAFDANGNVKDSGIASTGAGLSTVIDGTGTPSVTGVTQLNVPPSSLVNNGGGSVTLIGGLVLLEEHTANNSPSLNFTNCISAAFDEYEIHFINVVPGTNNVSFQTRVSTNGGASYVGGTSYNYGMLYSGISDVPTQVSGTGVSAIDLAHSVSTTTGYSINGKVTLFNPLGSLSFKFIEGKTQAMAIGNMYQWGNTGVYLASTPVNAFQILFSSGNIASGTVRVYGVVKTAMASAPQLFAGAVQQDVVESVPVNSDWRALQPTDIEDSHK